jgi:hypothetical protein
VPVNRTCPRVDLSSDSESRPNDDKLMAHRRISTKKREGLTARQTPSDQG